MSWSTPLPRSITHPDTKHKFVLLIRALNSQPIGTLKNVREWANLADPTQNSGSHRAVIGTSLNLLSLMGLVKKSKEVDQDRSYAYQTNGLIPLRDDLDTFKVKDNKIVPDLPEKHESPEL
jgi:hypothetical protein